MTFVLARGGYDAGIVSKPGYPRRSFRVEAKGVMDCYADHEAWVERLAAHSRAVIAALEVSSAA